MPHRVDRLPRYSTSFVNAYNGPAGELIMDDDIDDLVLQTGVRGGVRLAKKTALSILESQSVNVLSFGAKRDGTSNDTPAIQAAIDHAHANGMMAVVFPPGKYGLGGKVYNKDGIYLVGLGHVELHRMSHNYGTMIQFSPPEDAPDGNFLWQGIKNAGVINLIFQYHGDTLDIPKGEGGGVPLALGLCQNIVILNCDFYNRVGPHTIEVSGCKNVVIRDCHFYGAKEFNTDSIHREILQIEQSLTGAAITQSHIPYAHSRSENVVVDNCYFGPSSVFPTGPCCVGNHTASDEEFPIIDAKIINCTFDSPEFSAVNVYSVKNVTVSNCTFLNVPRCLNIMRRIPGAGGSGEWALSTNGLFFLGNFVEGSEGNGYLFESRVEPEYTGEVNSRNINIVIASNTFRQRNGTGHLFLRNSVNTLIQNNVFRGPCKVIISNAHGNFIMKNNLLQDYTEHAIWNDERNTTAANIGHHHVVDGNVFMGRHTAGDGILGRAMTFTGAGTGITVTNNIIRSIHSTSGFAEPMLFDGFDYVLVAGNIIYRINDYDSSKDFYFFSSSSGSHKTVGTNYLL